MRLTVGTKWSMDGPTEVTTDQPGPICIDGIDLEISTTGDGSIQIKATRSLVITPLSGNIVQVSPSGQ